MDRENRALYEDAARWAAYGVDCFLGQVVISTLLFVVVPLTIVPTMSVMPAFDWRVFMALYVTVWVLSAVPSALLAMVAKARLVSPLLKGELPVNIRRWSLAFTALALFFGMGLGIIVMGYADEKVKQLIATTQGGGRDLKPR